MTISEIVEQIENKILQGDVLDVLKQLPDKIVQCVITSPPYWGLRDYGTADWQGGDETCEHIEKNARNDAGNEFRPGREEPKKLQYKDTCPKCGATRIDNQLGLEETPEEYIAKMVTVFREVRRVLRDDGTLWLNMGDSYARKSGSEKQQSFGDSGDLDKYKSGSNKPPPGLKEKDLCGIPWRLALALQADGWYLRDAIIWVKAINFHGVDFGIPDNKTYGSNMPGSQQDRCTTAYEYVFQLTKSPKYYFDLYALKSKSGAMPRNVWFINTENFPDAHFATFAQELVRRCMVLSTSERGCCPECGTAWKRVVEITDPENRLGKGYHDHENDLQIGQRNVYPAEGRPQSKTIGWQPQCECVQKLSYYEPPHNSVKTITVLYEPDPCIVLDLFMGSGTVALVALKGNRRFIGIELNQDYIDMANKRIQPLLGQRILI